VRISVLSPTMVRASGADVVLGDLPGVWPSCPLAQAQRVLVPLVWDSTEPEDLEKLIAFYKIDPAKLIVFDPWSEGEIDAPPSLAGATWARTIFRSFEVKRLRILALPHIGAEDLLAPEEPFTHDASYLAALATGVETAVYNSLRAWSSTTPSSKGLSEREVGSAEAAAARAFISDNTERQPDGSFRTRGTAFSPNMYFAPVAAMKQAANKPRAFRVDVRAYNTVWTEKIATASFGGADQPLEKEARRLVANVYGSRILTATGWVPTDDLRSSLSRSRAAVAPQSLIGGSLPLRAVEAASAGKLVYVVGEIGAAPFGVDVSSWCRTIPIEDAARSGELIDAQLRAMPDAEVRAIGAEARKFYERYARPLVWPARLAEVLR
jgi:hypothetical protein